MGVLQRFERRVEGLVNNAFAKAFKGQVEPVEIAAALQRETEDKAAIVSRDRSIVPNRFVVELSPSDHERFAAYEGPLTAELAAMVEEHVAAQAYSTIGPVEISLHRVDTLDTGMFFVRSEVAAGHAQQAAHQDEPAPAPKAYAAQARPSPQSPWPAESADPSMTRLAFAQHEAPAPRASTERPAPFLEIEGSRVLLTGPVTVLGRGSDADIKLDDPGVSRRHAQVQISAGMARLVDLGSTNGTLVRGERVREAQLHDGVAFTVGTTTVTFRSGERPSW